MRRVRPAAKPLLSRIGQFASSKVSLRFIGSYLLMLIIPLVIFLYLLSNSYLSRMERQVETDNLQLTRTIGTNIVGALEGMRKIAHQISKSPDLSTYHLTESPLHASAGISQLANYIYGQSMIDDIVLVCDKSDYVYTAKYAPKKMEFLQSIDAGGLPDGELYERFFTAAGSFLSVNRKVDGIWSKHQVYILQDESSSSANRRAVLIFIPQNRFNAMLTVSSASAAVFGMTGRVIASSGSGEGLTDSQSGAVLASVPAASGVYASAYDSERFITIFRQNQLQLTLVVSASRRATLGDLSALKNRTFFILALVFLAGIIMIIFDMRMLYLPIYRLKQSVASTGVLCERENDEFKVLDRALMHFEAEQRSLSEQLASSRDLMRQKTILSLLQGSSSRQGQLEQSERDSGILFSHDSFCAVLMLPVDNKHLASILQGLEAMTESPVVIAGALVNQDECLGLILNFDCSYESCLNDYVCHLTDSVAAKLGCRVTAGVGGVCRRRIDIGRSHIEARAALDYRLIYGVGRVIFWDDVGHAPNSATTAPYELMKRLEVLLLDGNIEAVSTIIDQAIAQIKQGSMPLGSARCFAYDMINTILKVILISGTSADGDELRNMVMAEFETLDELAVAIKSTADRLCGVIVANKTRYNEGLLGNIRRYISENYLDYNFTVKLLAAEFGMSESNISHYYKNASGQNISDTINEMRIAKAKELLTGTSLPIREIVETIGYSDVSSFTRKFRLTVGVSPGVYRNTHTEKPVG